MQSLDRSNFVRFQYSASVTPRSLTNTAEEENISITTQAIRNKCTTRAPPRGVVTLFTDKTLYPSNRLFPSLSTTLGLDRLLQQDKVEEEETV